MFQGWRRKISGEPPEPENRPEPQERAEEASQTSERMVTERVVAIDGRRYGVDALGEDGLEKVRLIQAADQLIRNRKELVLALRRGRSAQAWRLEEHLRHHEPLPPQDDQPYGRR
jgi:hypothetical protein